MEEVSKVDPPVEPIHDELVNYLSGKYHYEGKEKEALSKKLTSDKSLFDKALREIHQDHFAEKPFDQFKSEYHSQYGNPFPEKKNSIQNSEVDQKDSSMESGDGAQNQSFLNQALNRIPKGSSDTEAKPEFDLNALIESLKKIPKNENEHEANQRIAKENEVARQENLGIQKLAEDTDKSGETTFKDEKGKDHSIDEVLDEDNTLDVFSKNMHNGFVSLAQAPSVFIKSISDLSGGVTLNSLMAEEDIRELEKQKMYIDRKSNKNILDNPSDPRSYAAIGGQMVPVALTALLTAGIGNAANVSSQGALALQGLNSLANTAPPIYISAKESGLSDNGAAAMTLITSPVIAALDMVGMGELLNNSATRSLVTKTGLEAIQEATENFTKKFTPEIAKKASAILAAKTPEIIKNITKKSSAEGITEGLQEGFAVGSEALYNEFFKDKDENGYNLDGWQKRILGSAAAGTAGGSVFGLAHNSQSPQIQQMTRTKDALVNDLNKETTTPAAKQIIDEQIKTIDKDIQEQTQAEEQIKAEEKAKQEQTSVLEAQKAELESNLVNEDISPETKVVIESKVKDIDTQIQEINPKQENENVTKETVEPVTEEKPQAETPAVQEGQQLEEKLVEPEKKSNEPSKEVLAKNSLISQVADYNSNPKVKNAGDLRQSIIQEAGKQGFKVGLTNGKITLQDSEGKKVNKTPIKHDKSTFKSLEERDPEVREFYNKINESGHLGAAGSVDLGKFDIGLSEKDFQKAKLDVQNGVKSAPAEQLLNFIEEVNKTKEVPISLGSGALNRKFNVPLDDFLGNQVTDAEVEDFLNNDSEESNLAKTLMSYADSEGNIDYKSLKDDIEKDPESFTNFVHELSKEELTTLKEIVDGQEQTFRGEQEESESSPSVDKNNEDGSQAQGKGKPEQQGSLQSIKDKARDARDSQDPEKAQEVVHEIDNILMRENIISGSDASFADPTSETFFDFLDQNKSVYRYHPDFKLAEGPFDLIDIAKNVPEEFRDEATKLDFSNGVSFDDAFRLGFVDTAKKLGYDGIRMMEIDGTDSTLQIWNFDKLDHIDGPELRNTNKKVEKSEEVEEKPPVPPTPTKEKAESKEQPKKKVLKVAQRILDSDMVSDEVKEGLVKKGIHYIPQSNEVTVADAKAIIENHGKEKAYDMVMNTSNAMKDLGRGAVARQLFETYSNDSKTAETEVERKDNLDKAVEIASFAAKMFKDAGQTIQSAKMWKRMLQKTPEGMLIAIEKDYSKQRDEAISAIEKELKEDKKSIDQFINENIDKILDSDAVKKAIDKIVASKKGKAKTKKDISDFFDGLKIKDDTNQAFEATYYIVKNAYNTAIEIIKKAVLAGVDVKEAVQKGIDSINSHPDQKGVWQEDKFRVEMTERVSNFVEPKKDFSKEISTSADKIKKIVKDHYTKGVKTKEGLSEKLVNELGLAPEEANAIAGKIQEEFSKAIKNQKSELLKKVSKAAGLNEKRKENLIKNIVKEIDLGTLDNQKLNDLYAESIGVATLTPEQKAHILKLAGTVKAAEDFVDKYKSEFTPANRKEYEKLKFEATKAFDELSELHGKKKDIWDTMATMMQGNLMTPLSIVTNIYSNAVMAPLRFTTKGVTSALDFLVSQAGKTKMGSKYFDPKRTTDFLATQKGYAKGFYKGAIIGGKQLYHGVPNEDLANRELEAGFRPMRAWAKVAQDVKTKNITNKTISDFTYALFGTAPEATFRALNFGDKPFSKAAAEAKAREIGEIAGLKGKELEKFIEFPDEPSMEKIKKAGERATFQQNEGLNKWIQESLTKLLNKLGDQPLIGKPAKLLAKTQMPFVKTPLNIISETIDYAVPPLSLMKGIYHLNKGDRAKGLEFISKAAVGTMIALVARQLFENGLLSPSSDDDEKVRSMQFEEMPPEGLNYSGFLRMMAGGNPKTQKTDHWINYKKMGPMGIIFNMHANRLDDKKGSKDENKAMSYVHDMFSSLPGIASASLEQSFLQGTNNLLTAIQEGGYKLDKWMTNTAMTISNIVIPNTIATASRSTNDYMPDLRGENFSDQFVNTLKSRYFMAGQLPPKVTMWGEPVKQTPEGRNRFIYHFLDPTKNKELRNNEWSYQVYELWKRTDNKESLPAVPDHSITVKKKSVKLTPDQYNNYASFIGKARARLVRAIVESDGWEKLDDEKKIKRLKNAYESGAKIGSREFKRLNK